MIRGRKFNRAVSDSPKKKKNVRNISSKISDSILRKVNFNLTIVFFKILKTVEQKMLNFIQIYIFLVNRVILQNITF